LIICKLFSSFMVLSNLGSLKLYHLCRRRGLRERKRLVTDYGREKAKGCGLQAKGEQQLELVEGYELMWYIHFFSKIKEGELYGIQHKED
ncbi:MAG: hypothetical protein C0392_15295, partial [Syntrophus sp. (in: bacteria)]|nr:hypothetical protein [Syntrophus sp. (in: bacteria)]